MSLSFPSLVLPSCVSWNFKQSSEFSTIRQDPQSKRRPAAATLQQSVVYELELSYEFLKNQGIDYSDDLAYVVEFYEACRGSFGFFRFDPSQLNLRSMTVTQDVTKLSSGFFGTGDGITQSFNLWRSTSALGTGTPTQCELMQFVPQLDGVYSNGTLVTAGNYTLSQYPAFITFNAAPTLGAVLSWAGKYSYLCRFAEDTLDVNEFLYQFWELRSLKLETVLL